MERDILVLFEYERKRRPELAALAARIGTMSVQEIRDVEVALPWMRDALLKLKAKGRVEALRAIIENAVIDGVVGDPIGAMRRWIGPDTYLKMSSAVNVIAPSLLVTSGTLVWLGPTGMWIDTLHTAQIDPRLYANSSACGNVTRSAYNAAVREKARGTTMCEHVEPVSQVRFFRPG